MHTTGIIRRVDDLGRLVIPKEIRESLKICSGDPLEVFLDEEDGEVVGVSFRKYAASDDIREDIHKILRNLKEGFYDGLDIETHQNLFVQLEKAEQVVHTKIKE